LFKEIGGLIMNGEVRIKKLDERAVVPSYGSEYAAGFDLYSVLDEDVTIKSGETYLVHTGLAMEIPVGFAGMIFARSGLATKKGLAPANKVGVVDSDYRGEVMVALHNHSLEDRTISHGERIAQMVIMPFYKAEFLKVEELNDTDRGTGGFGSTGSK
jgi:dUTP pyrophosphatase